MYMRESESLEWSVVVLSTIMDDQLAFSKEEGVRLHLVWCVYDLLFLLVGQVWQIILELPLVRTVWDHEAKFERVVAQYSASEVVSFHHLHVLNRSGADAEHHRECNIL